MRVGYLTYGLDRAPTGIGRYVVELARAFAALAPATGVELVLLTTEREDHHGLWGRFEHHALPGCYLLPGLMTLGNAWLSLAARRYRLDIIHDPNGVAPFLGPRLGARRVVTIHDMFAYVYPDKHNRLDNWRYRWLLPTAVRRADALITISDCSRRDIARYFGIGAESVFVVAVGVDAIFGPEADGDEPQRVLSRYGIRTPYLLYVGGLNARKNLARLFEAFAAIHPSYPDLTLVVGGKRQWQTSEMDATFRRLKLEDCVHFSGYLEDRDLPAVYRGARLFLFPSLYEGFGLPPLEAMACGTPVITSNTSSLPEVVGDAAILVDPTGWRRLPARCAACLTTPRLRPTCARQGCSGRGASPGSGRPARYPRSTRR
ncbi:MAG: glycosyltransferase family 4 protein [Chloroflexaceae bacterium]|nr:glycosyltransferase family 4 protein [Chloroflexaceae bacterium]